MKAAAGRERAMEEPATAMNVRMQNEHVGDVYIDNESWTMGYLLKDSLRPLVDYVGCTRMHPPDIMRLHMRVRLGEGGDQEELRRVLDQSIRECKGMLHGLAETFDAEFTKFASSKKEPVDTT